VSQLEAMGQPLFAPPNVKGWREGESWLNTSTVLARHNFAHTIASGALRDTNRYQALSARERELELARAEQEAAVQRAEEARRAALEAELKAQGKPVPPRPVKKVPPPPPPPENMDVAGLVKQQKANTPEAVAGLLI